MSRHTGFNGLLCRDDIAPRCLRPISAFAGRAVLMRKTQQPPGSSALRPPRLDRFRTATLESHGRPEVVRRSLGEPEGRMRQNLSRLRAAGVAQTLALYDPRRLGRTCETSVRVKLRDYAPEAMSRLEDRLRDDPAVTMMVFVAGPHDYELRVFHVDAKDAKLWVQALESEPAVRWVRALSVRTIFGDDLPGMRLGRL